MLIARYQRAGGIHFGSLEGDVLKRLSGDLFGRLTPTDQIDPLKDVKLLSPVDPPRKSWGRSQLRFPY